MQASSGRAQPLPSLTALRFFAAFYVLLFHFAPRAALTASPSLFRRLLEAGFTGVTLFFILSGFILAYNHQEIRNTFAFLRARFARIYPLYVFALLLLVPSFLHGRSDPLRVWALVADLLLVQAWFAKIALALNTPAWTLSSEAFFYVAFPFLLPSLKRIRRPLVAVLLLWALQLALPCLCIYGLEPAHPGWSPGFSAFLLMPIARLGEFAAGMVMGFTFRQHPRRTSGWLVLGALLCSVAALSLNLLLPHEVVRNGLLVGPYSLLIWSLAGWQTPVLSAWPLQIGGEISYGVYILQIPFTHFMNAVEVRLRLPALTSPWWFLAIFPFSFLTYECIEKPGRALILRRRLTAPDKPIPTPQLNLP